MSNRWKSNVNRKPGRDSSDVEFVHDHSDCRSSDPRNNHTASNILGDNETKSSHLFQRHATGLGDRIRNSFKVTK